MELPAGRRFRERVEEVREVHVLAHVDEVPVVDPGPPHALLVDPEAERPDEVEHGPRRGAQAGDVPRVRRDLRLHEDDVEGRRQGRGAKAGRGVRRSRHRGVGAGRLADAREDGARLGRFAQDDVDGDSVRTVASPLPMGSLARALLRLAAALRLSMASLLAATRGAGAGGWTRRPSGSCSSRAGGCPGGLTCQPIAANPDRRDQGGHARRLSDYACRPDNVAFKNLVSELGFALAPSTMHGARTVGFGGFVLSLEAAYTHINSNDSTHANPATGYQGGSSTGTLGTQGSTDANGNYSTQNNSPDSLIGVYTLMVRKGLPFGFELDGALGYVQNTSLWTIGADVRWAILEGFRTGPMGYIPDIAIGGGVRTVTGSSKMYLTTVGIDAELSKPFTLSDSGGDYAVPRVSAPHHLRELGGARRDSERERRAAVRRRRGETRRRARRTARTTSPGRTSRTTATSTTTSRSTRCS